MDLWENVTLSASLKHRNKVLKGSIAKKDILSVISQHKPIAIYQNNFNKPDVKESLKVKILQTNKTILT